MPKHFQHPALATRLTDAVAGSTKIPSRPFLPEKDNVNISVFGQLRAVDGGLPALTTTSNP